MSGGRIDVHAHLQRFPTVGHSMHGQEPARFTSTVTDWAGRIAELMSTPVANDDMRRTWTDNAAGWVENEAFINRRSVTTPGGRMTFACWRSKAENAVFTLGTDVLVARLPEPPKPPPPHAPGPTAFADGARTASILETAGWRSVEVRPLDFGCDYGHAGSDGVEERPAATVGSTTGRLVRRQLEPVIGPDGWAALLDDVRTELRDNLVGGAVTFPGAVWLVTATNPG